MDLPEYVRSAASLGLHYSRLQEGGVHQRVRSDAGAHIEMTLVPLRLRHRGLM